MLNNFYKFFYDASLC